MGNSVREMDVKTATGRAVGFYDGVQSDQQAAAAADHPTDLSALSDGAFDGLARHGFEAADATLTSYAASRFPRSLPWSCLL
jgi:NTE family protein